MDDLLNNFAMDDLLNNFAHQRTQSHTDERFAQQILESPTEENYIYHFVDGSPEGSEHGRSHQPAAAASAEMRNSDPFFHIEDADSPQATGGENEDERDYHADIEDDDEDDYIYERNGTSNFDDYHHNINTESANPDRLSHWQLQYPTFEMRAPENKAANSETLKLPSVLGDKEQEADSLSQHLRQLHRQDIERDELLMVKLPLSTPPRSPQSC